MKTRIRERIAAGDRGDQLQVLPYPSTLPDAYAARLEDMGRVGTERSVSIAMILGAVLGYERGTGNVTGLRLRSATWTPKCCCHNGWTPGRFSKPQMLLLPAEGLDSCAQIAWAEYHDTVREVVGPQAGEVLVCGLSIGYSDPDEPVVTMPRAEINELASFL